MTAVFGVSIDKNEISVGDSIGISSNAEIFANDTLYTNKELVSCNPKIAAVYKYDSAKKLTMVPREPLPSATTFSCTLDSSFLKDTRSDPQLSFGFSTDTFGIVDWDYLDKEKKLILYFNDTVDLATLNNNVVIYKVNKLARTKLGYRYTSNDGRTVALNITEDTDGELELELLTALATKSGTRLAEAQTFEIDKGNVKPAELDEKKTAMLFNEPPRMISNEDGTFAIRVFVDDTFDTNPIREFIHIDGINNIQFKKDNYIEYKDREKWGVESYYYTDILSDEFKPNTSYNITFKKGLSHYQELKEDANFTLRTGNRKKAVTFEQDKPYIASLGEIGFSTVNIDKATLIVEKITDDNFRYFINYNESRLEDAPKFTKELYAKDITLNNPLNEIVRQKVKLPGLTGNAKQGLYRIVIKYEDKDEKGKTVDREASKVIFVSDIAISANLSDKEAFISLSKLSDAAAVEGAKVELYSANNIMIAEAVTDGDGIAVISKDALLSKEPKVIVAKSGDDQSFLLLDKSLNDVTKEKLFSNPPRYSAFVYFQSDIVRPSATINSMIILKDRDFISGSKIPLKVTLKDPNYETVDESTYTTNDEGAIEYAYRLQNGDGTGRYTLSVKMGDDTIGSASLEVEAFMPPKIENSVKTAREYCKEGEFIDAKIASRYLFGAPASGLGGSVEFTATAKSYTDKAHRDYSFTNSLVGEGNEELYAQLTQDITLGSDGTASVIIPCSTEQNVPSVLKGTITATIMDDAQPVASYREITIYPYEKLVGLRLEQSFIRSDDKVKGTAVLIDPVSGKEQDGEISVVLKKRTWHYSYSGGNYKWESEIETVDSFSVQAGKAFERIVHENGDFIVEAVDRLGGHSATGELEVSGWGYSNISPRKSIRSVDITFPDKLYSRGDTIQASFKSPILEGNLLVTLEGEKVQWHKRVELSKGTATLDIPLEEDMGRGLYLHATAVRKTDLSDGVVPFRATGYKFVKPNREASRIKIELDYNATSPSKTLLPLTVSTDREALVLVSVVDAGILGITEQKPPKIFEFFNLPADALFMYFDIYDRVMNYLTEGKLIDFGADADEKRKKHLPPENLDRIKPFMLWSSFASTYEGKVRVNLDIPEFNGKATIVAIALTKDGVGVANGDFIVKDDIMIKPSYPRFLLQGDKLSIPVRVFNTTGEAKTLSLESNHTTNLTFDIGQKEITVAPNSSVVVNASLKALEEGKAEITISTVVDRKEYSNTLKIEVMTPYTLETESYRDTVTKKSVVRIASRYKGGKAIVSISDNPVGALYSELKYLIDYPYGCAEQISSRIAAMYHAKPYLRDKRLLGESDNFIRQGIKQLVKYQNYYGELNYWQEGYVDAYTSIYASEVLLELDRGGFTLDESVKKKLKNTLVNIANASSSLSGKYDNPLRVYAAFVLSENDMLESSIANMLYDNNIYKEYYISWYQMAAIFKNLGNEPLAARIYAGVSHIKLEDIRKVNYVSGARDFSSQARDIFLVFYYESKYFGKKKSSLIEAEKEFGKLYSTHDKAMAFRAMNAYLGQSVNNKMSLWLTINGVREKLDAPRVMTVDLDDDTVVIEPVSGIVHYDIEAYKNLPKEIKNELSYTDTLSIKREFVDEKGNPVDLSAIEQGSKLYSRVVISNMDKIDNVVLNQRIPACMEIIGQRSGSGVKTQNMTVTNKDIRDDRLLLFFNLSAKTENRYDPFTKKNIVQKVQNIATVTTPLMATARGECQLPAVIAEAMYDTRINNYAQESESITVMDRETAKKSKNNTVPVSQDVVGFVKDYYRLEEKNVRPAEYLGYFNFPIRNFFGKRNATKEFLMENRNINNQDWPKKEYTFTRVEIVGKADNGRYYDVLVEFDYRISKGNKERRGHSKQRLGISNTERGFWIDTIDMVR